MLLLIQHGLQQHLSGRQAAVQRSAHFVAHEAHELTLGFVGGLCQCVVFTCECVYQKCIRRISEDVLAPFAYPPRPLSMQCLSYLLTFLPLFTQTHTFSRATDSARCAACACALARARCALMRACASRSSLLCAFCAKRWLANIWRRYHSVCVLLLHFLIQHSSFV